MTPEDALPLIVCALGGRRSGNAFACRCPLHDDRRPSLSLFIGADDGALVPWCHAGCPISELVGYFRERRLWPDQPSGPADVARLRADEKAYRRERWLLARQIWAQTRPLELTPGEHYLRERRGIRLDPGPHVRWHWREFALVAKITHPLSDRATGVQLTPLNKYTNERRRPFTGETMDRVTIGSHGVVKLGAVWPERSMLLGEGVETVLSGMALYRGRCGWATLGSSMLARLTRGGVPLGPTLIGLLVDRDKAGEAACAKAAVGIRAQDFRREVRLLRPPVGCNDFNDLARDLAAASLGGAEPCTNTTKATPPDSKAVRPEPHLGMRVKSTSPA